MGTQGDDAGATSRARAGTLVVIGTMAAIAVVSVTAVVAWARLAQPGGGEAAATAVEELPVVLADGTDLQPVPDVVAAAVDRPVVGTVRLRELPDEMLASCMEGDNISWGAGGPDVEYAFITVDGAVAALRGGGDVVGDIDVGPGGEQPTGVRITCDLQLEDGSVINHGSSFEHIFPGAPHGGGGFAGSSCCDRAGLATASASVGVPPGADWLLHDRGSWLLAYDVEGLEHVAVSWKYRERRMGPGGPPMSSVLFLADDGAVVGEATAGGPF